jgi:IS605 OrfB family transposase
VRDVNRGLSKALVSTAHDPSRGCAVEDLKHIRERISVKRTVGKRQRRVLQSWAFLQVRACIAYKAALAGVAVVQVDPAYTSHTCSRCGPYEKADRRSQAFFRCVACGFPAHAELNAAVTIRDRAALIPPDAAPLARQLQAPGLSRGVYDCREWASLT